MTDRELLEAAAKVADLDAVFQMYGWNEIGDGAFLDANEPPTVWNPLTDDGDALRLAVKLGVSFDTWLGQSLAIAPLQKDCLELHNGDPYAATRRAIVRAAAAMGEKA